MTDSTSSSFMDGHGTVQTRDPIVVALRDIEYMARAARGCVDHGIHTGPPAYATAVDAVAQIESLASGLVQELTLLRDKEKGEGK